MRRKRKRQGLGPNDLMKKFRTIAADDLFLELLDNPKVFPLLWDILGWNIQLYISHLIVYPPEGTGMYHEPERGLVGIRMGADLYKKWSVHIHDSRLK